MKLVMGHVSKFCKIGKKEIIDFTFKYILCNFVAKPLVKCRITKIPREFWMRYLAHEKNFAAVIANDYTSRRNHKCKYKVDMLTLNRTCECQPGTN